MDLNPISRSPGSERSERPGTSESGSNPSQRIFSETNFQAARFIAPRTDFCVMPWDLSPARRSANEVSDRLAPVQTPRDEVPRGSQSRRDCSLPASEFL